MEIPQFIVTNVIKLVQDAQIQEMIIVLAAILITQMFLDIVSLILVEINNIYQFMVFAMDVTLDVINVLDLVYMLV